MRTKTIRQRATFKASSHKVYEALMDSKKHSELTGSKASISRKIGGKFTVWNGDLEGTNLALIPDEKIVQSWRLSDWMAGHYSKATFSLKEIDGSTRLTFTQTGVPEESYQDESYQDVSQGWRDYYWKPMKEMLKN